MKYSILISLFFLLFTNSSMVKNRGEVAAYKSKFIWSETGEAFVPNYIMIDVIANQWEEGSGNDLSRITEENLDTFISEFICGHGFNGIHVPVYGQWFHIGNEKVSANDSVIDQRTFDKLKMIISKVYASGGCTHLWLWGDDSRKQTSNSLADGIMGTQEKMLLDEIYKQLNPLNGWTMGYGFDLWEWVTKEELKQWHEYMRQKKGWNQLLGARASKNDINQIYDGLDYAGYEYHKPWYPDLVKMRCHLPDKPSFSEDRYRIRTPSKYPEKDYNAEETRRGLWHHTMAGGIAAIWGNLDGAGVYPNKQAIKCFSVFWNDHDRFKKDMVIDNTLTNGYCLKDANNSYVYYKDSTEVVEFAFTGNPRRVVAVDTRKNYREMKLGKLKAGKHLFRAPYNSDWAIAAE